MNAIFNAGGKAIVSNFSDEVADVAAAAQALLAGGTLPAGVQLVATNHVLPADFGAHEWLWQGGALVKDQSAAKARTWQRIKYERDQRADQGGFKVGTKWFHSDQKSRGQQLGLVLLGANIPANLQWKTMDGSFVAMTQALAGQILAAGAASDTAIFAVAETHRLAMEASADPAAYDFSGGWPAVFGG
jgi:hypothetical protein